MKLKPPYIDLISRNVNLYFNPSDKRPEEVVKEFIESNPFYMVKDVEDLFGVTTSKVFEMTRTGLQKYQLSFSKWVQVEKMDPEEETKYHDQTHLSNIRTLISHADLISFLMDQCEVSFQERLLYNAPYNERRMGIDNTGRAISPILDQVFVHHTKIDSYEKEKRIRELVEGRVGMLSTNELMKHPDMSRPGKDDTLVPYSKSSIQLLSDVADIVHILFPETPNARKGVVRRPMIRFLIRSENQCKQYKDLLKIVYKNHICYVDLKEDIQVTAHLDGYGLYGFVKTKVNSLRLGDVDALYLEPGELVHELLIDIKKNNKTRLLEVTGSIR